MCENVHKRRHSNLQVVVVVEVIYIFVFTTLRVVLTSFFSSFWRKCDIVIYVKYIIEHLIEVMNLLHESVASVSAVVPSGVTPCWMQMETSTWTTRWTWPAMWRSCSAGLWPTSGAVSSPEPPAYLQVFSIFSNRKAHTCILCPTGL